MGTESCCFLPIRVSIWPAACSGQSLWQVLPLGPTSYGDSPYQALSAFAGNAGVLIRAYVSARLLGREGMIRVSEYSTLNANYLAKRLADALGLPDGLTGEPQRVPIDVGRGELWAMMLDAPAMFERVVRANATDDEQADRIVANRFYRNMASALSGTQEYMASEALHELHGDERFDLVVVDTPPSRNAPTAAASTPAAIRRSRRFVTGRASGLEEGAS